MHKDFELGPIPADLRCIPPRGEYTHKGSYGRVLIVGGSYGMHGAVALTAAAAFRSGAGLVRIACPASIYSLVGAVEVRATYLPLPETEVGSLHGDALDLLLAAQRDADLVAIGPGMGQASETKEFLRRFVPRVEPPLVLDADGLNAFAGEPAAMAGPRKCTIVTPHPGELQRLTGQKPGSEDDTRRVAAIDLAMRIGGTVILKGHRSVVTDGIDVHFNESGNPGMATAGSGDVLTGVLAALVPLLPNPLLAARVSTFAHGRAGDLAAKRLGPVGVTATDILEELPHALRELVADDGTTE